LIKCALFDLDGTLVNTIIDLARATDFVLEKHGLKKNWNEQDYKSFVGNGARVLIDRAFEHTLNEQELDSALEEFKIKYNQILLDNIYIYDGITDALDYLKSRGIKIAVVSNKPHESAVKMVETLFGKNYFDVICGANENDPKKPDPFTANKTLKQLGCNADEAVFFGDSDVDVYTAKNAGIKSIGCSWGFRSAQCLLSAGPDSIIDSPKYIVKLFKKKC